MYASFLHHLGKFTKLVSNIKKKHKNTTNPFLVQVKINQKVLISFSAFTLINSGKKTVVPLKPPVVALTNLNKTQVKEEEEEEEEEKFTCGEKVSHKIDQVLMAIFPASFLVFMIMYWSYYT